jgi:hypothetical protein
MRRIVLLIAIALLSGIGAYADDLPTGVVVERLDHKVLSGPDKDGDVRISVKAVVKNTTDRDVEIDITLEAIDAEDFEVLDVPLSGTIPAHGAKALSDWQYLAEKTYKTIATWRLEDD